MDGEANNHWMGSDGFLFEFGNVAPADVAIYSTSVAAGSACCAVFSSGGGGWWEKGQVVEKMVHVYLVMQCFFYFPVIQARH